MGTTDNQALELRVNSSRALRIEPDTANNEHNIIAGNYANAANGGAWGATISGGGSDGGYENRVTGSFGTVGGGMANVAGESAFVGGGRYNQAPGSAAVVAGGWENHATGVESAVGGGWMNRASADFATIAGGGPSGDPMTTNNRVFDNFGTIGGGGGNRAGSDDADPATAHFATVAGGEQNTASGPHSVVSGGQLNKATAYNAAVGGGLDNDANAGASTVSGGWGNDISSGASYATVAGGWNNDVGNLGESGAIGGGQGNLVEGSYATIPGGQGNTASGSHSFAAGRRAKAMHQGAFVLADSTDADFASTAADQFLVRAGGGVGINTASPQAQLDVQGAGSARIRAKSLGGAADVVIDRPNTGEIAGIEFNTNNRISGAYWQIGMGPGGENLDFAANEQAHMTITPEGNVGIGHSTPWAKLNIRAEGSEKMLVIEHDNSINMFGPEISLRRTRGGSDTWNDDILGWIEGSGTRMGGQEPGAAIMMAASDDWSVSPKARINFMVNNGSGMQDAMRLTHEGRLGINVSDPMAKLQVWSGPASNLPAAFFDIEAHDPNPGTQDNTAAMGAEVMSDSIGVEDGVVAASFTARSLAPPATTLGHMGGMRIEMANEGTGTVSGMSGLSIEAPINNGTIGNTTGIRISNLSSGTRPAGSVHAIVSQDPDARTALAGPLVAGSATSRPYNAFGPAETTGGRCTDASDVVISRNLELHGTGYFNSAVNMYNNLYVGGVAELVSVGIGTAEPEAKLDVEGDMRLRPSAAPATPYAGHIYNDGAGIRYYDGSAWKTLATVPPNSWVIGGNAGTAPTTMAAGDYIGTSDNTRLDIRVNNVHAMSFIPAGTEAPTIIAAPGLNGLPPVGIQGAGILSGGLNGNAVHSHYSVIAGGDQNQAGTSGMLAGGQFATVGGGQQNIAGSAHSTVSGGFSNSASGQYSAVGGGELNTSTNAWSAVGGGYGNQATGESSVVGGGENNKASSTYATATGGVSNQANSMYSTVSGGSSNMTTGDYAFVGGGHYNRVQAMYGTIAGGGPYNTGTPSTTSNYVYSNYGTIGGGGGNRTGVNGNPAGPTYATIGGGEQNTASGQWSVVAGGRINTASASYATVGGGDYSQAYADHSTVSGGWNNSAGGTAATVPGGMNNSATGNYSFAAGRQAKAQHQGTFVWADAQGVDFATSGQNQFIVRAQNGVGINKNNPATALDVMGTVTATGLAIPTGAMAGRVLTSDGSGNATWQPGGWALGGNAGTDGGINFVGTTDNMQLSFRVNNMVGLRIQPNATTPNIVGGHVNNTASGVGATIGGGGDAGTPNSVTGNYGTVGGGVGNIANQWSTVAGGLANQAANGGFYQAIGGGQGNQAKWDWATVSGGQNNIVGEGSTTHGSIGGGLNNSVSGNYTTVGGGANNVALATYGTIAGGGPSDPGNPTTTNNRVFDNYGTIGGGGGNRAGSDDADPLTAQYATIAGGQTNAASNNHATVAGGQQNAASGQWATVAGGWQNQATGYRSAVAGGSSNQASLNYTFVGGGLTNYASGSYSVVSGGRNNRATASDATVGGGYDNLVEASFGTIAGGGRSNPADANTNNRVFSNYGTVGGGGWNRAGISGDLTGGAYATIAGGLNNRAFASNSFIGGGYGNVATGYATFIGGGDMNRTSEDNATVGGGTANFSDGMYSSILGGQQNRATEVASTVGGGRYNVVQVAYGTIAGGGPTDLLNPTTTNNAVFSEYGTIGGGGYNRAGQSGNPTGRTYATVSGGRQNEASGQYATIGGGRNNFASSTDATVAGGTYNTAGATQATVGGGTNNTATGSYATVPGGYNNTASGTSSFAAGNRARATHQGAFVWADSYSSDFTSAAIDRFHVRAGGGVYMYTNSGATAGAYLAAGSGTWTNLSDRNMKENVEAVDGEELLMKLAAVPVQTWNYKSEGASIRHMGPMAQDFHSAFGLGDSDKGITTVDADGVALAAARALTDRTDELRRANESLEERVSDLERQNGDLNSRVEELERLVRELLNQR